MKLCCIPTWKQLHGGGGETSSRIALGQGINGDPLDMEGIQVEHEEGKAGEGGGVEAEAEGRAAEWEREWEAEGRAAEQEQEREVEVEVEVEEEGGVGVEGEGVLDSWLGNGKGGMRIRMQKELRKQRRGKSWKRRIWHIGKLHSKV